MVLLLAEIVTLMITIVVENKMFAGAAALFDDTCKPWLTTIPSPLNLDATINDFITVSFHLCCC